MPQPETIFFDIAAVAIMAITLASLVLRRIVSGPSGRVYLTSMGLVTLTAIACLASNVPAPPAPQELRAALQIAYYALLSLTAPMYLVLIATVTSTTHRLNSGNAIRAALWTPMIAVIALIATNPLHHLVFTYTAALHRGPLILALYLSAAYYCAIGLFWIIRWRKVLTHDEFATLTMLYPIVLASVAIQFFRPTLHVEMFFTSIAMMMISAFVIRPEVTLDSLVNAASLPAYREMCRRAFITGRPLCLTYLEIINLEKLRELVGKDEIQTLVQQVSNNLSTTLQLDDTLFYLRNGLFCIASRWVNADRALAIAKRAHEEGRSRDQMREQPQGASSHPEQEPRSPFSPMMRICVLSVPDDVPNEATLKAFVRRFAHLLPDSRVTAYAELARQPGFSVQIALSNIVARAISNRSFEIHYQPIYNVATGTFRSAEALIRLHDPEFSWIPPSLFIPEAEQSGAILDIASIQLEKTCAFLSRIDLDALGLDYIEINLSIDQCIRPGFAAELLALLRRHGIDPRRLNFEITETSSAFSHEMVTDNIRTLTTAGASFSLDDYGTGFSNVMRVLELPFSLVKFDKCFTDHLDDPTVRTVLSDSVAMMHALNKQTLAEGVETESQAKTLIALGLDYLQGYFYAKPLPEPDFLTSLAHPPSP